jgi:hypothetical protein
VKFLWPTQRTLLVLAKDKTIFARLWTSVRDDRPSGDPSPPAAISYYALDRRGEHPRRHLRTYSRILQADAYDGFNDLYLPGRTPAPIIEAACWAHGRRKLFVLADVAKAPLAVEAVLHETRHVALDKLAVRPAPKTPEEPASPQILFAFHLPVLRC